MASPRTSRKSTALIVGCATSVGLRPPCVTHPATLSLQIDASRHDCRAAADYRTGEKAAWIISLFSCRTVQRAASGENFSRASRLVISRLWRESLPDRAKKLRFIQSIGAGTDQFLRQELVRRDTRLARSPPHTCGNKGPYRRDKLRSL
jgi:hypothetical protein